jgi:hypothetical protein
MRDVESKVKTAFTRRYNKEGGFLPYSVPQHAKKKTAAPEISEYGEEVSTSIQESTFWTSPSSPRPPGIRCQPMSFRGKYEKVGKNKIVIKKEDR